MDGGQRGREVSPAHGNTSVLELSFSVARGANADDPRKYQAFVANQALAKVGRALDNNPMYCPNDVGPLSAGNKIGPREMINVSASRKKHTLGEIDKFFNKETRPDSGIKAFGTDTASIILPSLPETERRVLSKIAQKNIPTSYASLLLKENSFIQWMQLSVGTPVHIWFQYFLKDTLECGGSAILDNLCRKIQHKLLEITVKSLKQRKNDTYSFEYGLHEYYRSIDFAHLYWEEAPRRLANNHAGCVILCIVLGEIHLRWVKDAFRSDRRHRNRELFYKVSTHALTPAEKNNEVNSFVGWSIASTLKLVNVKDDKTTDSEKVKMLEVIKQILKSMIIRERNIDAEYMSKYYDTNMLLYNQGGLALITKEYFEWAKQLMDEARLNFTENHIDTDPHNSFGIAEKFIMKNNTLRSAFVSLCCKYSGVNDVSAIRTVYDIFVPKVLHARFAVVFRDWKMKYVSKVGDVGLRAKLKATVDKKKAAKGRRDDTDNTQPAKKMKPCLDSGFDDELANHDIVYNIPNQP